MYTNIAQKYFYLNKNDYKIIIYFIILHVQLKVCIKTLHCFHTVVISFVRYEEPEFLMCHIPIIQYNIL